VVILAHKGTCPKNLRVGKRNVKVVHRRRCEPCIGITHVYSYASKRPHVQRCLKRSESSDKP